MLDLSGNQLADFILPAGMSRLTALNVGENNLTDVILPAGLLNLTSLNLSYNLLTNLALGGDLSQLSELYVNENQLSTLIVPSGVDNLQLLNFDPNPLTSVVVPAGNPLLGQVFLALRNHNVHLLLNPSAKSARRLADGSFAFEVYGDVGTVVVQRSTELKTWQEVGVVAITWPNYPGFTFIDTNSPPLEKAFYRLKLPLK